MEQFACSSCDWSGGMFLGNKKITELFCPRCGRLNTLCRFIDDQNTYDQSLNEENSISDAKKLAKAHWEWLYGLAEVSLPVTDRRWFPVGEYLYKTAFEHGYKHGREDRNAS